MPDYDETTYGERIAEVYDTLTEVPTDTDEAVALLSELAGGGRALDLGIGTGRLALPLRARGIRVEGIDASPAMVEKLRSKPGGQEIPVTMGNFADLQVDGRFSLIFVAFNTFFALLTQEDQLRCFAGVAAHLEPQGAFTIEAFVPDLSRFDRGQRLQAMNVEMELVRIDVARHDPVAQQIVAQHVVFTEAGTRFYPVWLRYCWPSELDLMARLAGLRLESRWGGWLKEPFTGASGKHVSLYRAAPWMGPGGPLT
jgi:SAM-dependent methyltransferase